MSSPPTRGNRADPAEIYGDNYKQDNRGKQLGINKVAVKQPKPYGNEGRGIEVKESDEYEDELEAKMAKMLNRNQHTQVKDASAKAKHTCARCTSPITEDDKWVTALDKLFHVRCFTCVDCKKNLKDEPRYFDKAGQPQCPKCEREGQDNCGTCGKAFKSDESTLKAMGKVHHPACFMCTKCHKKLAEELKFREKNGKPYCEACSSNA